MLVVHPTSSCDVCLEPYGAGIKSPHSISCGHVFCLGCLDAITSGVCPLCREHFHPMETRRLHIDLDCQQGGVTSSPKPCPADSISEARRLQDSIARIVKDGSSEAHLRTLIEQCATFLKTQHRSQHEDLRVSFRMISYLCDVKSSLRKQLDASTRLAQEHEALRSHLATELKAAELKYLELLQTSTDERETALAVEISLREHYKQVLQRCEEAESECEHLAREMERLRYDPLSVLTMPTPSELARKVEVPFPTDEDMLAAMIKAKRLERPDDDAEEKDKGLYLSPLPEILDKLPSSLKSFNPLPEVDCVSDNGDNEDDEDGEYESTDEDEEDEEEDEDEEDVKHMPESVASVPTPLRLAAEPMLRNTPPIPRTSSEVVPKVTSGLSLTAPTGHSAPIFDREPPRPTLRIPAFQFSTQRTSRHSSPSPFNPPASAIDLRKHSPPIPDRETYTRDRGRSFVLGESEPEHLRTQLQELLSNPVSASLPNISHFPSVVPFPAKPPSPPSRSSSSTLQRPALTAPNPPAPAPAIPHNTHNPHTSLTIQRQAISSASSAALALEKERQKAEKERQREKERQIAERDQRPHLDSKPSASSLREPGNKHNLHFISSVQNSGTRRDLTNVYGTSTISGASSSLREAIGSTTGLSHGAGSLREPSTIHGASQLSRHPSTMAHGKKRLNLHGLFA